MYRHTPAALLTSLFIGAVSPAQAWQQYNVSRMINDPIDNSYTLRALGINSTNQQLLSLDVIGPSYAYMLCIGGECTPQSVPDGLPDWTVTALNDLGWLAGSVYGGQNYAFVGSQVIGYDRAGCPGCGFGMNSQSMAVNFTGMSTGWAQFVEGGSTHAFKYTPGGGLSDLGTLGGSTSEGRSINTSGQIAGNSKLPGDVVTHAFRHQAGVMTDLGSLGGPSRNSYAYAINAAGKVVGCSYNNASPTPFLQAFRHNGISMTALPGLSPTRSSCAYAVNNPGVAVGYGYNNQGAQRAVIFKNTQSANLNTLIAPGNPGWTLVEATGINDSGVIVGNGIYDGVLQGFVLTPLP